MVYLSDRKVRVERPRLRRRGAGEGGEVEVPAYAAMRRPGAVADRMLEVLMAGVSTRKYGRVIGEMADTVGVSKSAVSREKPGRRQLIGGQTLGAPTVQASRGETGGGLVCIPWLHLGAFRSA